MVKHKYSIFIKLFIYAKYSHLRFTISTLKFIIKILLSLLLYFIKTKFATTCKFKLTTIVQYNAFLFYLCVEISSIVQILIQLFHILTNKLNRRLTIWICCPVIIQIFYIAQYFYSNAIRYTTRNNQYIVIAYIELYFTKLIFFIIHHIIISGITAKKYYHLSLRQSL